MTAEAQLWLIDHAPIMGGAEAFLLKIARHAGRRRDVRPVVLCPGASELAQRCRAADVEVWPLAMPHFASAQAVGIPAAIARMARLLRRAPPGTGLVGASAWSQALLAACAPWLPGRRIVHLLAAQDPGYAGRIERAIAGHGLGDRIRLCGRVDSVTGFLDGLDALVVPSTGTEGQPTVVLEALARGVDVIVRDAVFSDDYRGLPVTAYRDPPQLRAALDRKSVV